MYTFCNKRLFCTKLMSKKQRYQCSDVLKFFLGKHGEIHHINYKIFEIQVAGISKDNLHKFKISEKNNYFRQIMKFKFLPKSQLKKK